MIENPGQKFYFWNKTRYLILSLTLICMTLGQINSVSFNFTIICMEDLITDYHLDNSTGLHWMEDPTKKSLIFSGSAIGAILGLFPAVFLINRYGIRTTLTLCGFLSSLSSLLFPLSVSLSYPTVILIRILEGMSVSAMITVVTVISANWSPFSEMGTNLAILSCFFQLSMIICMPISGFLCKSWMGWRSIYYVFGVATAIFYLFFFIFYQNDPKNHPRVSDKELELIRKDKLQAEVKATVPYFAILKDPTVIAAFLSFIGSDIAILLLILFGPTYLRKVLNFDVIGAGFASSIPYICSILIKLICGRLSDKLTVISLKSRFITFCGLSHILQAVCLVIMSRTDSRVIAQIAFTGAITVAGINVMGNVRCVQLRTRQYVHFTMGVATFIGCTISFLTPLVVGFLCPNNSPEEWSLTFLYAAIIVIIFYIPFPIFTSDQPGPYVVKLIT